MIICFEGTPGSGKSYEAVKKIIDNLMLGRVVYTNIDGIDDPLCREHIKSFSGLTDYELETRLIHLSNFDALEFYKIVPNKSLVVLDEVHKLYNNRNWQKDINVRFADWSSTHRKSGNDVILVTQNLEKVDAQVRGLVEWTYRFKKLNMLGRLFRNGYKRQSYTEDDTSGKPMDVKFFKYNSRIYPCYKSYTNDDIKELNIMEHTNLLKHPVFLILPVVLFLAIYLIFFKSSFATGDLFGSKKILKRADSIKSESQPEFLYAGNAADKIKSMAGKSLSGGSTGSQGSVNMLKPSPTRDLKLPVVTTFNFPENKGVDFITGSKSDQEVPNGGILYKPTDGSSKPVRGKKYGECYSTGFVEKEGRRIELLDCGGYYKYQDLKDSGQP
mgnify:FL=1